MRTGIGDRVKAFATRIAVLLFAVSLGLFESDLLRRLSRLRHVGRTGRAPRQPRGDAPQAGETQPQTPHRAVGERWPAPLEARPAVPIVLIHQNNAEHLGYSLAQAKWSNPTSTVFLLGDDSNGQYADVSHHPFRDYCAGASEFEAIYRHFSTHPWSFELICFQRWFMLAEFMRANRIDRCVYLDSDVLLYANATDDIEKFRRFDFTLCWNTIGCVVFVNRLEGLEHLCQFMMDVYSKRDRYQYDKLVSHFAVRQRNRLPGGACDMTALQMYNEINFGSVGEASHIIDGTVYDPNINMPHPGFEMEDGLKKVVWREGYPYGTYLPTGETIRFNSLHFNGRAKSLMHRYCTAELTPARPRIVLGR